MAWGLNHDTRLVGFRNLARRNSQGKSAIIHRDETIRNCDASLSPEAELCSPLKPDAALCGRREQIHPRNPKKIYHYSLVVDRATPHTCIHSHTRKKKLSHCQSSHFLGNNGCLGRPPNRCFLTLSASPFPPQLEALGYEYYSIKKNSSIQIDIKHEVEHLRTRIKIAYLAGSFNESDCQHIGHSLLL